MARAEARYILTAKDETGAAFESAKARFRSAARVATQVGATVTAGLAASFAATAKSVINTADEIGKLSTQIGASSEALSEYRGIAELTGVSFNTLTTAWQRQTRRLAEAAQGTGEAKDALEELGLSAAELAAMRPEQQFEILADAIAGVENHADRVRIAMRLWDTEGVKLLRTIDGGSASLMRMREEQRLLGNSMSGELIQNATRFNDAMTAIQQSFSGAVTAGLSGELGNIASLMESIASFAPTLVEFFNKIAGITLGLGEFIGGTAALGEALNRRNLGQAGSILKDLFSRFTSDEIESKQDEQTEVLRQIRDEGLVGRAG